MKLLRDAECLCFVSCLILGAFGNRAFAEALAWKKAESFRSASLSVPTNGRTGFTALTAAQTGIVFTNTLPLPRILANQNLLNGSGVGLGDYDGDGLCDIYLCNLNGTNALYKSLGNWKFKDVTAEAGVTCYGQSCTGAVFADINGDGFLDLLVTSMGGPNACFLNQGNGKFINITQQAEGNGALAVEVFTPLSGWLRVNPEFKAAVTDCTGDDRERAAAAGRLARGSHCPRVDRSAPRFDACQPVDLLQRSPAHDATGVAG